MDNFYISVRLAHELTGEDWVTNICGTMRKHRGEPDEIKSLTLKGLKEGAVLSRHNGTVLVLAWKAKPKKIVKMLTSHHQDKMVECTQKKAGHREALKVLKPECVTFYNQGMNAVDCLDQNIGYYPCMRKTTKWTKKFVVYLFQIAAYNAYVVYKARTGNTGSNLEFLMAVCRAWTNWDVSPLPPPGQEGPPLADTGEEEGAGEEERAVSAAVEGAVSEEDDEVEGPGPSHPPTPRSPYVDPDSRLDGNRWQHFLVPLPKETGKAGRRYCRVCKRKKDARILALKAAGKRVPKEPATPRGRLQCRQCLVTLCPGYCDAVYHTKADYLKDYAF